MNVFRTLRKEVGLSQGDVAKKMGYTSPQFVSNWERDLSCPPPDSVKKLAKIYGRDDFEEMYFDHAVIQFKKSLEKKMRRVK